MLSRARQSKLLFGFLVVLLIAISFWTSSARQYLSFDNPRTDIHHMEVIDVDYHFLYPALEAKHSFAETFNWWREPWRGDANMGGYWRPILMQVWWVEAHVLGEDRSSNWMRISLLLSALFDVLFVVFLLAFTKRRLLALLGLAIWTLPPEWLAPFSPLSALPRFSNTDLLLCHGWKDQPDLFCNCLVLGAIILALRNRFAWALVCCAIAIGFKEPGVMGFPLIFILVGATKGIKSIPKRFYWGIALIAVLVLIGRWSAGPYVFYMRTYGRKISAAPRYINAMMPLGLTAAYSVGQAIFGVGVFGIVLSKYKRPVPILLALIGLFSLAVALVSWQERLSLDVGFAQFVLIGAKPILLLLLWLASLAVLYSQKQFLRLAWPLALAAFVAAIPFALASQATDHVLALARAFLAGYGACLTLAVFSFIGKKLNSWKFRTNALILKA